MSIDPSTPTESRNGLLDLSDWKHEDGLVKLDGQWEFYWHRHLMFDDFLLDPMLQPDLIVKVPNEWNGYRVNETRLSGTGFATYKLTVKVKETGQELALKSCPKQPPTECM